MPGASASPGVTVVRLVHAYDRRQRSSVWIVPGSLADFEDPANENLYPHIDDYLPKRGILITAKVKPDEAAELVHQAARKFQEAGIDVTAETLCDD